MQNLQITSRGVDLSDTVRDYIYRKISKVQRVFDRHIEVHCEIIQRKSKIGVGKGIEIEISIALPKAYIKVEKNGDTIEQVIDEIEPLLKRQLKKYKAKISRKNKKVKLTDVMLAY